MEKASPRELVAQFLADRSVPCPGCRYDLRGLRSDRCPECGHPLELQLNLAKTFNIRWMIGFVGLSAVFGALLSALLAVLFIARGPLGAMPITLFQLVYCGAMSILLLILLRAWYKGRDAFNRSSAVFQWTMACACMLATPLNLLVNFIYLFLMGFLFI